ncbi:Tetratricopeptide TPR_2 repeat protein [Candidatus Sulfopaludibacter sp. SbA4]|nr:Tetratricopeptide TPR_2 repeat protein [Candidatus Sulfopaludibacter sp. SbA4]
MKRLLAASAFLAACGWLLLHAQLVRTGDARLWRYRNLGKALYENPTTQKDAVEQFRQALALAPNAAREQLNYGLALLRAGDLETGIAQLEKAQKTDPKLPHTWFNLGITFQKQGEFDRAFAEFQQMVRLVPNEAVSHYHLGAIHKLKGETPAAIHEFVTARDLNPRLAAPHFQLYGLFRQADRAPEAAAELRIFQEIKKQQEGAAVPEDMDWSWYSEIYDPPEGSPATLAAATWRDEKIADGYSGATVLAADGVHPSVIAWSPAHVTLFRNGRTPVADSGLEDLRDVVSIAPGDFDNDGLPDLCVITSKAAVLYRNVNGKFRKHADLATGTFRSAFWVDFDHDYDPDVFLLGDDSKLMRNNGEAGFSDETKRFPFVAGRAVSAQRIEVEPDTPAFDFVMSYEDHAPLLYRDKLGGAYVAQAFLPVLPSVPQASADFTGNGRADRVVISNNALTLQHNIATNYGNWIEISLTGVKSSKLALDAKIEVKAGSLYEKEIYQGVPIVFRLGDRTQIDTVRITWANGLIQNETQPPINRVLTIKEAPRLSGSCPMIFTWNGERFEFVTDVLGVAPLGASSGDGAYFPVDHDEYVSIPGDRLKARGGQYEIRVTEELREVTYLDQIKLIALDHPAALDIVTNEKFKSPPFPEFRLFGVDRRIYPLRAYDDQGNDVLAALRQRDSVYPDAFRRDHAGVAELHRLDLDFGNAAPANHAVLVLSGWVDWADGSTFLGATQAHKDLTFPYLQVKDAAGNWKTVIEDMGIPSGKPKTMAVDLTGKFLSSSREVRIVTNLCVYWDEIFLVENDAAPEVRMTTVPLTAADLHFRGFSKATIHPERKQPERFDYDSVSFTSMWNPTAGNYTRYGAVDGLLAEPDDRMVVMGSGDEVRLRFAAAALPPVPAGWKRDFLLLVDGWAKDADANTAFSQTVLPLPFHAMKHYGEPGPDLHESLTRPALRLIRPLNAQLPPPPAAAQSSPADVAQALVPAVSRLVSTPLRRCATVAQASVGMSADAAGMSACATASREP